MGYPVVFHRHHHNGRVRGQNPDHRRREDSRTAADGDGSNRDGGCNRTDCIISGGTTDAPEGGFIEIGSDESWKKPRIVKTTKK